MTTTFGVEARPSALKRWLFVAAFAAALALAWFLRGVLVPLFFAFLVAYALDPLVDRLEKLRVPRGLGALVVMVASIAVLVLVLFFAVPLVIDEFENAARRLPEQLDALRVAAKDWLWARYHYKLPITWSEILTKYGEVLHQAAPSAGSVASALFGTVNAIFLALGTLIVPVLSLYLLADFNGIIAGAARLVPRRWAGPVEEVALSIHGTLGRYVRGQLLTNLVLSVLYATGLTLVGVRLALPIGVLTGMLAFVPYVGLFTGTFLAVLMAVLDWQSMGHVLLTFGTMMGIGLLDSMVVTPRIVGGSVGLKPIEVLLTMMAAATLFGFFGVLLAVPLGAVLKILVGRGVDAYLASRFYAEPGRAGAAPPAAAEERPALGTAGAG
jgi:predicted PurR-regulated permease PerM